MIERPSSQKYMNGVPYAAQSQYKELPNENQSINGVLPLDTCPAGWWNGLWNFVTEQEIKITEDMDVIIKEIVAVIERAGIIDVTAQNTLSRAIVTLAQTIATSNVPGAVISSSDDGAIAVDNTGKMTLNGYNDLISGIGDLSDLDTTEKSSVVSAINEIIGLKGQPNGIATLDADGRIPYSQLPESAVEYKGEWNAETNTPPLVDGTGTTGDMYYVSEGGTQDLGSGDINFLAGDRIIYNGTVWQRLSGGSVKSVNNIRPDDTGNVQLAFSNLDGTVANSQIANNAVTTAKIDDNAVTNAKFGDVLPISKGGTGATTATNASNIFLNALRTGQDIPKDGDYYISQWAGGSELPDTDENKNLYIRRPVSAFWTYIQNKISSVLGLTASNYNGTVNTATNATTANTFTYVVDSNQKLLDWANNVAGNDYSSVLIKKGTWTSSKSVNLTDCGTKVVVGEVGSLLNFTSIRGLFYNTVPTSSEYYMLNVHININYSSTIFQIFKNCTNLTNCSGTVDSSNSIYNQGICFDTCTNLTNCSGTNSRGPTRIFNRCTNLTNCSGTTTTSGSGLCICFDACTNLTNCSGSSTSTANYGICFDTCTNLTNCSGAGAGASTGYGYGYGFRDCKGVSKCKASGNCTTAVFQTSYASQSANNTYACADTPEGGFNDTTNPST